MEFALLGWPDSAPRLRLDYRRFSYAGKFVTSNTGIAVIRAGDDTPQSDSQLDPLPDGVDAADFADDILAAVSFSPDRTDETTLVIRYLTVRNDLRGSGRELGPKLAVFLTAKAADCSYDRMRIAVNNAFSFHALYKAGFAYTGQQTGLAELVLTRPVDEPAAATPATYQRGLELFRERDGLSAVEREFLTNRVDAEPPELISLATTAVTE